MTRPIKVFGDQAKQIKDGELFQATVGSVEGRTVVTLEKVENSGGQHEYELTTDIAHIISHYDVPMELLQQIRSLVIKFVSVKA